MHVFSKFFLAKESIFTVSLIKLIQLFLFITQFLPPVDLMFVPMWPALTWSKFISAVCV